MTKNMWVRYGCVAIAAHLLGCGEKNDDITIDEVPTEVSARLCDAYTRCLGGAFTNERNGEDCETSSASNLKNTEVARWRDAIAKGTLLYHKDKIHECLEDYVSGDCADFDFDRPPPSCKEALEGQIELGHNCEASVECKGNAYCNYPTLQCPGVCTAPATAGGSCERTGNCARGLFCNVGLTGGTCAAFSTTGQSCKDDTACVFGDLCAGSGGDQGQCTHVSSFFSRTEGQQCNIFDFEFCAAGLSCVATQRSGDNIITVCTKPFPAGGACRLGVPNPCPSGQYCNVDLSGPTNIDGSCVNLPTEGQDCAGVFLSEVSCASGFDCVDDKCIRILDNGQSCTEDGQCRSEICDGGICVAPDLCDPQDI